MAEFSREEVEKAFARYLEVQQARDWPKFADVFTEDAVYEESHFGTFRGREEIREFLKKSMAGLEEWTFPTEWSAIDGSRVVFKWLNRLPGRRADGSHFEFPGITVLEYGGGNLWSYEEDIYNFETCLAVMKEWREAQAR